MMKQCVLLLILSALCIEHAAAQQRNVKAISVGPELNIPQRSGYNIGYGVSGKFELPVTSTFSLVFIGGLHQFHAKTFFKGTTGDKDTFIPLKAGARYYVDPRFYTEGELGTVIDHNNNFDQNLFAYSLGTGFLLPLNNNTHSMIDIGLRYEDWSRNRVQQFAIRAAYRFGW
jgi:hypothetical protein